ncbi:barstar family protein [Burkholderia stagnalis]|uniref:barstar family protein n=1 Tax=Burkholderia stagnalis TaxID=1503054 RepID=UPI001E2AC4ED|nr:barstar family protein [Burkholderia stagnalis]
MAHADKPENAMPTVCIDAAEIADWTSFHRVFAQAFGFPAFYGDNMNAFIDCLGYLDDPTAEMTRFHVRPGETLAIQLWAANSFGKRCPEQFRALQDACAFVNGRRTCEDGVPLVALSYHD